MKKNRLNILLSGVLLVIILASMPLMAACAPKEPTGPIVLKVVGSFGPPHPVFVPFQRTIDTINERAEGELVIEWVGAGEVMSRSVLAKACQDGVIDIMYTYASVYVNLVPLASTLMISDKEAYEERDTGYYDLLVDAHEEAGFRFIGRQARAGLNMQTTIPAKSPADLEGSIWAFASEVTNQAVFAFGGTTAAVGYRETYTGFERGLIQGRVQAVSTSVAMSLPEVAPYVVGPILWPMSSQVWVMNLDSWNRLPKHLQDLILEVQMEGEPWMVEYEKERDINDMKIAIEKGVQRIEWSQADSEAFIAQVRANNWAFAETQLGDAALTAKVRGMISN
ncbi:TRAP transporter substrate-binding protein [Chloroflexota bacterium]